MTPTLPPPETDNRAQVDIAILEISRDHRPIAGKPGEFKEVHIIEWAKRGTNATTRETVDRLRKMPQLWERIEPSYERWLKGQETPVDGTPLEAWPGLTKGQVEHLRLLHVRSVEELAGVTDSTLDKIGMGARALRERARLFVQAKQGSAQLEAALVERDEENARLREEMAELRALVETLKPKKGRKAEAA